MFFLTNIVWAEAGIRGEDLKDPYPVLPPPNSIMRDLRVLADHSM